MIIPLEDDVKVRIDKFSWVSWSEVSQEELIKRGIFEQFIKTGTLSDEDQKFCDSIDWYPVDELPLKKEFVQRIKEQSRKSAVKKMSAAEFSKWCNSL